MNQPRPIREIAADIARAWPIPNYAARPYLEALHALGTVQDMYGCDDGRSVVLYFLSNANGFRGSMATALKAELRACLRGVRS